MTSKKKLNENVGKVLVDVGKLIFASIVLGSIIKGDIDKLYLLIFGSIVALVCIYGGILFLSKKED
jgi:hypothetical protein